MHSTALKFSVFLLSFFPFWIAYSLLIISSTGTRAEVDTNIFEALGYAASVVGVATILGGVNFLRINKKSKQKNKFHLLKFLTTEFVLLVLFLALWLIISEFILMTYFYDDNIKELGLLGIIKLIISKTGKLYSGLFLYVSYAGMSYAYCFFEQHKISALKAKQAKELANEMKMKAVMNYMQPHFFFNCISSITELIHIDPNKADSALIKLSGILRYVIDHKKQLHSIESELDLTNSYIELQKIRYGNRFQYIEEVDENYLGVKIPILSIQLLVENSFLHAANNFNEFNDIHISIKIYSTENNLHIYVCDNGAMKSFPQKQGDGTSMLLSRMNAAYDSLEFSHGYLDNTINNSPGYQSHISISL